jgi:hypothetical protein
MKLRCLPNPIDRIRVPDSWNTVDEFAEWWIAAGSPMRFPPQAEIFVSDDATAVSIFRHGQFQVELYLIHPVPTVPVHEHPGVDVIKIQIGMEGHERGIWLSPALIDGASHGAGIKLDDQRGFPLIAVQHWKTRAPITIAAMWKGPTVGPLHEALITRFNPDAYVTPGYADITRHKENTDV